MRTFTKVTVLALAAVLTGTVCGVVFAADAPPVVEMHGYMQNRVYFAPGTSPQFRTERLALSATASLQDNARAYSEVYYQPWAPASGLYLESAYYDRPVDTAHVRVGKGRRLTFGITPTYPNRKTTNYGIVSEAFTQDRIQGIQYYFLKGIVDFGATLQTGYRLGTRNIGEIPGDDPQNATHAVPHLCYRDIPGQLSEKSGLSTRLGTILPYGLKAGVSLYLATLDPRDLAGLTTPGAPGPTATAALRPANPLLPATTVIVPLLPAGTTNDAMRTIGGDIVYSNPKVTNFVAQGEYYGAKASTLEYNGWDVLVGWAPPVGWKYFARYGQQNMHTPATNNPLSWDEEQLTLSIVQPISKTVWLQYEGEFNTAKTDTGAKPKDNVFFVELFTGF